MNDSPPLEFAESLRELQPDSGAGKPAGNLREAAAFSIPYRQFLGCDGTALAPLPDFAQDPAQLIALYKTMVRTRAFDAKAVALQRTGRLGTFPSSLGQEASAVGAAAALRAEDIMLPSFREQGAMFWRGVTMTEYLLYWGGDERGNDFAGPRQDFPICIPIGSQAPHAAGVALACKLRNAGQAALCFLGDGATSKGEVYEAMNLAGAWSLPLVFVVCNNRWALSLAADRQTAAETLAQKAIAAGFAGEQVDGNDVIAVRHRVEIALDKARGGGGPTLVEALTYRLTDHTTVDDARRYRDDAEVSAAWQNDPLSRLRQYIGATGVWSKAQEEALLSDSALEVEAAVQAYLAMPPQPPEALFDHLYAELPETLHAQRNALLQEVAEHD